MDFQNSHEVKSLNWLKEQANLSLQTMEILDSHLHGDEAVQEIYGRSQRKYHIKSLPPPGTGTQFPDQWRSDDPCLW